VAQVYLQLFFDVSYQHVNSNGDPDLGFDGILGSSIKHFDPKVLFDPFEKYLDLPATLKQLSDEQCR
jgi:hypothetical protein